MGTWLRSPRTTQERRINGKRSQIAVDGYEVKIRAKRSQASLPEAWDDIPRKDLEPGKDIEKNNINAKNKTGHCYTKRFKNEAGQRNCPRVSCLNGLFDEQN